MKAHYALPSATYTLKLSPKEFNKLLHTGRVGSKLATEIPCTARRSKWDSEIKDMVSSEKQEIYNDVRIMLEEPIDDIGPGLHPVQFINIIIDTGEDE